MSLKTTHSRVGWGLVSLSLIAGSTLEALEAFRWAGLLDEWTRRLWSLAHFHGVALGLVNLVYVQWAESEALSASARRWASNALVIGSVLMPLGFVLGAFGHYETDPSLGIVCSPLGAMGLVVCAALQAKAAWVPKRPDGS